MGDEHQTTCGDRTPAKPAGKRLRLLPVTFLVLALLALALGIWFKLHTAPPPESRHW